MKILCISDYIDPLIYSNTIKERFKNIDLILSAGDLPMEYIDFVVSSLNKPAYFVFGNHNLKDFSFYHQTNPYKNATPNWNLEHFHGAVYAGFKTVRCGDLLIAGASGSMLYNNGQCQYTDFQMKCKLIKLIPNLILNKIRYGRYLDIFLTHAPPEGIHDKTDRCHKGFKCYKWFIKKFKPKYQIHGHIHLYSLQDIRCTKFCDTEIINAYSYYILETE